MTSSSKYLEIEHCHAVCDELRVELAKTKQQRDALASEVDESNERVAEVTAERDALAAHALELIKACQLAVSMFVANDINVPNTIETLQDAIDATPRLCLAEIRAEAGREGFIEGARQQKQIGWCSIYGMQDGAHKYAAKEQQGGAE